MRLFVITAALLASVALVGAQEKKGGKKGGGFQLPPMIHIAIADFADDGARTNVVDSNGACAEMGDVQTMGLRIQTLVVPARRITG